MQGFVYRESGGPRTTVLNRTQANEWFFSEWVGLGRMNEMSWHDQFQFGLQFVQTDRIVIRAQAHFYN